MDVFQDFPVDPLNLERLTAPDEPRPITIISGFLGSGKTTLLNYILHADHGLKVAVLVNDFGDINIDSQMVVDIEGEDLISLENGCVCCTIRGDLLNSVLALFERDEIPEYFVIEASGVSYPAEIAKTFLLPELGPFIFVDSILAVIDADQVLDLTGESEVLAIDQVSMSDIVILNKTDLTTEEKLEKVRIWVRNIVPMSRILETSFAQVPIEYLLGVGAYNPQKMAQLSTNEIHVHGIDSADHDHDDHTLVFHTWSHTSHQPLAFAAVREVIYTLSREIIRAKGWLHIADLPEERILFQLAGTRATLTLAGKWGASTPRNEIVFISAEADIDTMDLELRFESCQKQHFAEEEMEFLTREEIEHWMRIQ